MLSASTLAISAALLPASAFAQDTVAQPEAETTQLAQAQAQTEDAAIVVTGSRIVRREFESIEPSIVVGEEYIEDRGFTNAAEALNELPAFGLSGSSPIGNAQGIGNVGANFVNFFGLGSQRTLTVVNGRRFVAANTPTVFNQGAPGLQVDLNVIPTSIIDRIETIAVGGAPVYGSDAIAGTVNVIIKRNFEGIEVGASYGISERGDFRDWRVNALFGANTADGRGNVMVAVEHNERTGLIITDRNRFNPSLSFQTNPENTGPDDGIPDRVLITDPRVTIATFGGLPSLLFGNPFFGVPISNASAEFLQFGPSGDLIPFDPGEQFGAVFSSGGDGISLDDVGNLYTPYERTIITGFGRYEVTPGVELYSELWFARTRANDQISQAVWNTDFFGGTSAALEFDIDNPFLTDQARSTIQATCDATGIGDDCTFLLSRLGRDVARGNNETKQNLYRIVAGIRGDFELIGRGWNYDISYNYGNAQSNSSSDGISDRRFSFALDAVAVDAADIAGLPGAETLNIVRGGNVLVDVLASSLQPGDIVCGVELDRPDPSRPNPGDESLNADIDACVPLNYFGEGNVSAQALNYVNLPFTSEGEIEQKIFEANLAGDLFDLWAGPVALAFGYQHREEFAAFRPDAAYQTGIGRSAAITPTQGDFSTDEYYGELSIPLVSRGMDWPVLSSAIAEVKGRYVDNSVAGGDWTYTAGGRIGIFDDQVTFRGNYTRSIRSPALVEAFLPTSTIFSRAQDPCDASRITAGPNPANRQANCQAAAAALGFTDLANFQSLVENATAQGTTGGNPNLENETATAWTVGAILQPDFVPRLQLAVDYVNIRIRDAISSLGLTQILQACYDQDPANFPNEFCARFSRGAGDAGQDAFQVLDGFSSGYANAGFQNFQGVTAVANYLMDINRTFGNGEADWGELGIAGSLFNLIEQETSVTGFDLNEPRGEIGTSKWRGQLNLNWNRGPIGLFWQTRYIGPAIFDNDDSPESRDVLGVGDYWLFNAGVQFRPAENLEVQFNVDNVFDKSQPFAVGASANFFAYDQIGRYYRATARLRF